MTDRRSFLRGSSVLLGSVALGDVLAAFAASPRKASFFAEGELRALRAVVDVILPATDSPAASAADTHYFIDLAIPACATPEGQKTFRDGVAGMTTCEHSDADVDKTVAAVEKTVDLLMVEGVV